jgi:hypothetical protein
MELTHAKVYLWDDTVLVTGANLSENYFTDRQDRYLVVRSRGLADFMAKYVDVIAAMSSKLRVDGITEHPYRTDRTKFEAKAVKRLNKLLAPRLEDYAVGSSIPAAEYTTDGIPDTVICPLVQAGSWGVRRDENATEELLTALESGSTTWLATGYFNLTQRWVGAACCVPTCVHSSFTGYILTFDGSTGSLQACERDRFTLPERCSNSDGITPGQRLSWSAGHSGAHTSSVHTPREPLPCVASAAYGRQSGPHARVQS